MELADKIALLGRRFANRTDVFTEQRYWTDRKTGKIRGGYFPVRTDECPRTCRPGECPHTVPLDGEALRAHIEGDWTVGVYQLNDDGRVTWLCLDVDIPSRCELDPEEAIAAIKTRTLRLARTLKELGVPFLVEHSGSKGYHLWVFFSEPVVAIKAKALGYFVLDRTAEVPNTNVEVFPKQDGNAGGYGNLVKIPLGIHRKSMRRCVFVNGRFEPYNDEEQWHRLDLVRSLSNTELTALLREHNVPRPRRVTKTEYAMDDTGVGDLTPPCMVNIRNGVADGAMDVAAFKYACYSRDRGYDEEQTTAMLEVWNSRNDPPIDDLDVKVRSAFKGNYPWWPCQEPLLDPYCSPTCSRYESKMRRRKGR